MQATLKNPTNANLLLLLFERGFRVVLFFLLILHSVAAGNPSDLQKWGERLGFC